MRNGRSLVIIASALTVGCFAARLPPPAEFSLPQEPAPISVGVAVPSMTPEFPDIDARLAETIASDLEATHLFESVEVLSSTSPRTDVQVSLTEWKRPPPESWCYESYPYTVFTAFVVPGCGRVLGYRLLFNPRPDRQVAFDFEYDELHISGWVALGLLPFPGWQLPPQDRIRLAEHLRAQLAPLVPELVSEASGP
jgi:hypothetical protein